MIRQGKLLPKLRSLRSGKCRRVGYVQRARLMICAGLHRKARFAMIAIEDLHPNSTFEDNCGHRFVLRTFSVRLVLGPDGTPRLNGTATLETLVLKPNEESLTLSVPIDGVPLLRKIADYDLSPFSSTATEIHLIVSDAA
jgi:hypothetical protein